MRTLMTAAPVVMAVLALTPGQRSNGQWHHVASDRFIVFAEGAADRALTALETAGRYEQLYQALLSVEDVGPVKPTLVVFDDEREFQSYRSASDADAFFLDTPNGPFVVIRSLNGDADETMAHEVVHFVVSRANAIYPLWLNEGLAQYYSTAEVRKAQVRLGKAPSKALAALRSGALLPIEQLVQLDESSLAQLDSQLTGRVYAESWALTHMLFHHGDYSESASMVMDAVAGGRPLAQVLLQYGGKSMADVEGDLRKYLSRLRLPTIDVDFDAGAPTSEPPSQADPADERALDLTLAQLLLWQPTLSTLGRRRP